MKHIKRLFTLIIVVLLTINSYSQNYKVRIGFIGNSITEGANLPDKLTQAYPMVTASLLQKKYGDTCIVMNSGVSGRTLLKHGDYPIWNEQLFKNCWQFAPDILYIMLGTNDSKPYNWEPYKNDFFTDYVSMVDTFKKRNPRLKLIVAFPPPAFKTSGFDIRDSVIRKHIIPLIDSIRKKYDAVLVDFYTTLLDSDIYFQDNIHPNVQGSAIMGKIVYDTIIKNDLVHKVDTGYTYVTSLKTLTPFLSNNDSAEITYTTMNATNAYLNGEPVPLNGKIKVRAATKTTYKLVAKGKLGSDSLNLTIDFYQPVLTRINVSPGSIKVFKGVDVNLSLIFYDQKNTVLKQPDYIVSWVLSKGQGTFKSKTNTSAVFTTGGTDTINIVVVVDTVTSNTSKIIIKPFTEISDVNDAKKEVTAYPNPSQDIVHFKLNLNQRTSVSIKIYDLKGAVRIEESKLINTGEQVFSIKTEGLVSGVYLYEVNYGGKSYTGKINVVK